MRTPRHWRTTSPRPFETRGAKALTALLRYHGKILPDDRVRICKLRPGRNQRSVGAWLWCAYSEHTPPVEVVGCLFKLSDILRSPAVSFVRGPGGLEIFPELTAAGRYRRSHPSRQS